jgi:hypothetical protein
MGSRRKYVHPSFPMITRAIELRKPFEGKQLSWEAIRVVIGKEYGEAPSAYTLRDYVGREGSFEDHANYVGLSKDGRSLSV